MLQGAEPELVADDEGDKAQRHLCEDAVALHGGKAAKAAFGIKVIEDALVMCGVLRDDGWQYIQAFTSRFALDKEKPRIVVRITDEGAE